MTEIDIIKFLHNRDEEDIIYENVKEYSWRRNYDNGRKGELTLHIWVEPEQLHKFCKLLGASAFDDGGYCETWLCADGSVCVSNFDEVLEHYGINAQNIISKKEN